MSIDTRAIYNQLVAVVGAWQAQGLIADYHADMDIRVIHKDGTHTLISIWADFEIVCVCGHRRDEHEGYLSDCMHPDETHACGCLWFQPERRETCNSSGSDRP